MAKMSEIDKEYENDVRLKKEEVKSIQAWVSSQPHLPDISEQEALWFLQSRYYNIEPAKVAIDRYFTIRTRSPDIFHARNEESIRENCKESLIHMLPRETHEGYRVLFMYLTLKDTERFCFIDELKKIDVVFSLELKLNGTQNGLRVVFDVSRVPVGVLTKFNLAHVRTAFIYLQEAVPVRLMGLHILHVKPFVHTVYTMCRPFMSKEIVKIIHFHKDIHELSKFVPVECLPKDYGGADDSVEVLRGKMLEHLLKNQEFIKQQDNQRVDETQRPKSSKSSSSKFKKQDSFKHLDDE